MVTIFGYPTQNAQARRGHDPTSFLRTLFLIPPSTSSSPYTSSHSRHTRRTPSSNSKLVSPTTSHVRPPSTASSSSSVPFGQAFILPPPRPLRNLHLSSALLYSDDASVRQLRPQSGHGFHIGHPPTPESAHLDLPRHSFGTRTISDDFTTTRHPLRSSTMISGSDSLTPSPKLPHAYVVSRLERASIATQAAFSEVLRTRSVIFDDGDSSEDSIEPRAGKGDAWNLPQGFFVVYVCGTGHGHEQAPVTQFLVGCVLNRVWKKLLISLTFLLSLIGLHSAQTSTSCLR